MFYFSVLLTDSQRSSVGLFDHVLVYMGDLHLVHHALNLSILEAGLLVQQVSLMMFSLTMVDYPMSFLLLSTWNFCGGQLQGTNPRCWWWPKRFLCQPQSLLDLYLIGTWLGLGFFGTKGLGTGLDNLSHILDTYYTLI